MRTALLDEKELRSISPDILAAYAAAAGWKIVGEYGSHCDLYGAADKPELIIPRTSRLVDYASGVAELIQYFAASAEKDAQSVFRDLTYARCDVIRARAGGDQDSLPFNVALGLMEGSKSLLTAALRSLNNPKKAYRGRVGGSKAELLNKIRFGQTEKGSLVMTLLTPPIEPTHEGTQAKMAAASDPIERQMTRRLMEALEAARGAVDQADEGESRAFELAVKKGVSANLCDALVKMTTPFPELTIEATWAKTMPIETSCSEARFVKDDVGILEKAAAELKQKEEPDETLTGFVVRLHRPENEKHGTIILKTTFEGQSRKVSAVLKEGDYAKAIQAHGEKGQITLNGDLEQTTKQWTLQNAHFVGKQQDEQRELRKEK